MLSIDNTSPETLLPLAVACMALLAGAFLGSRLAGRYNASWVRVMGVVLFVFCLALGGKAVAWLTVTLAAIGVSAVLAPFISVAALSFIGGLTLTSLTTPAKACDKNDEK